MRLLFVVLFDFAAHEPVTWSFPDRWGHIVKLKTAQPAQPVNRKIPQFLGRQHDFKGGVLKFQQTRQVNQAKVMEERNGGVAVVHQKRATVPFFERPFQSQIGADEAETEYRLEFFVVPGSQFHVVHARKHIAKLWRKCTGVKIGGR